MFVIITVRSGKREAHTKFHVVARLLFARIVVPVALSSCHGPPCLHGNRSPAYGRRVFSGVVKSPAEVQ